MSYYVATQIIISLSIEPMEVFSFFNAMTTCRKGPHMQSSSDLRQNWVEILKMLVEDNSCANFKTLLLKTQQRKTLKSVVVLRHQRKSTTC